jgi:hypothetical protein
MGFAEKRNQNLDGPASVAQLKCPLCFKPTRHRSAPVVPDIPRAVLADGTCDKCWRHNLKLQIRRKGSVLASSDDKAMQDREALAAYVANRRRRGIDPEGNADLDAAYEDDREWKREHNRKHQRKADAE